MPPKKREKDAEASKTPKSETIHADHELFLQAFEKPTQIYRFLRTRNMISPIFLNRTLLYMKQRMSRSHKGRKNFKIDSLLERIESKCLPIAIPGFMNITFLGYFDKSLDFNPQNVLVETILVKICHKKRKDSASPALQVSFGTVEISLNPSDSQNQLLPSISIPKESFNLNSGPLVKSYVLLLRVQCLGSLDESEPAAKRRNKSLNEFEPASKRRNVIGQGNGNFEGTLPGQNQLKSHEEDEKYTNEHRHKLSLNSRNLTTFKNETDIDEHTHNSRANLTNKITQNSRNIPTFKTEIDKDENNEHKRKISQNSRSLTTFKNEIDPDELKYNSRANLSLENNENKRKMSVNSRNVTTFKNEIDEDEKKDDEKQNSSLRNIATLRNEITPDNSRANINSKMSPNSRNIPTLKSKIDENNGRANVTKLFCSELVVYDKHNRCLLTDGDYELSLSEVTQNNKNSLRKHCSWEYITDLNESFIPFDSFNNSPLIKFKLTWSKDANTSDQPKKNEKRKEDDKNKIVYQFLYNNNSRQQTEACEDLHCPWCSINCMTLYSLLKHLKLCHNRFCFTYVPISQGARIDVSINELYDGSYTGSPHDLISQPTFSRNGPIRRSTVTNILVCKPKRVKASLNEFLEPDDLEFDGQRTFITGHNRLYHHATTCLPIFPKEMELDSEDENDPKWLQVKTSLMIDEFTDVNEGEKELMKLWNLHVMKYNYVGNCQMSLAGQNFLNHKGLELLNKNLYKNFIIHLCNLHDFNLISPVNLYSTIKKLQDLILKNDNLQKILNVSRENQVRRWVSQQPVAQQRKNATQNGQRRKNTRKI